MQGSRKRGGEFIKEFGKIMVDEIAHTFKSCGAGVLPQIHRLLAIWEERRVFPTKYISSIRDAVSQHVPPKEKAPLPVDLTVTDNSSKDPISDYLDKIEQSTVINDLLAEKVSSIRSGLLNGELLKDLKSQEDLRELAQELDEGCKNLEQYKKRLQEDLERRTGLCAVLEEQLQKQREAMNNSSTNLKKSTEKIQQTEEIKEKMKELLDKLPPGQVQELYNPASVPRANSITPPKSRPQTSPQAPQQVAGGQQRSPILQQNSQQNSQNHQQSPNLTANKRRFSQTTTQSLQDYKNKKSNTNNNSPFMASQTPPLSSFGSNLNTSPQQPTLHSPQQLPQHLPPQEHSQQHQQSSQPLPPQHSPQHLPPQHLPSSPQSSQHLPTPHPSIQPQMLPPQPSQHNMISQHQPSPLLQPLLSHQPLQQSFNPNFGEYSAQPPPIQSAPIISHDYNSVQMGAPQFMQMHHLPQPVNMNPHLNLHNPHKAM